MLRAEIDSDNISEIVNRLYGLQVCKHTILDSYDDINIYVKVKMVAENNYITSVCKDGYVLKILNSLDSKKVDFVHAMHAAIDCVQQAGIITSGPVPNINGDLYSIEYFKTKGATHCQFLVRLFHYVPGMLLNGKQYTPKMCFQVGQLAGQLDKNFWHPALENHTRHWNIREVVNIRSWSHCIGNQHDLDLIHNTIDNFTVNVEKRLDKLQKGAIHGDFNETNILVTTTETKGEKYRIQGILDFGDLVHEYHVFEVAIAMTYMMIESGDLDPIIAGGHVLAGYVTEFQLQPEDYDTLKDCICGRIAQSLVYGAFTHYHNPSDMYCLKTSATGWPLLRRIWNIPKHELYLQWQSILKEYSLHVNFNP